MNRKIINAILRKYRKCEWYFLKFSPYSIVRDCTPKHQKPFNGLSKKELMRYCPRSRLSILELAYFGFVDVPPKKKNGDKVTTFLYNNQNLPLLRPDDIKEVLFSATFDDELSKRSIKFISSYTENYKIVGRICKRMIKIGNMKLKGYVKCAQP